MIRTNSRVARGVLPVLVLVTTFMFWSCSKAPVAPEFGGDENIQLAMDLQPALDRGFNVTRVHVTISRGAFTAEQDLEIEGSQASGTFEHLEAGSYAIEVEIFDGDTLIAAGSGSGEVIAGQVSVVEIEVSFVGDLQITVNWGSEGDRIVHLEIDGVEVASLPVPALPAASPLNLGGRHHYGGCSSLYDNVSVIINGVEVLSEDFSAGLGQWSPWGSPQPEVLSGCGNPDPAMRTNGDGNHPSGLCSNALFDWTGDWSITTDVKVVSGYSFFNAAIFGISFQTECVENVEPCVHVAWGDDHEIGEFWTECFGGTAVPIPSPQYDEWHTVVMWSEGPVLTP